MEKRKKPTISNHVFGVYVNP